MDVTTIDDDDRDRWNDYVERSPQGSPFHRLEALEVQARHSGTRLHLLVGHKGQEPVGAFPVFELRKGPIPLAFSPAPNLRVPYLGPVFLNVDKLKRRKRERRQRRFLEGCLDWLDETVGAWYAHVRTGDRLADVRPFVWDGCTVTPNYTYVVDLDREDLLGSFSRDARSNVTGDHPEYEIAVGDRPAIERIVEQVRARYRAQGESFGVPTAFVTDLYDALPDGGLRSYVLTVDGEFVGGILALAGGDGVYRWQGGVRTDADVDLPVNDLLDWRVMEDAREEGRSRYDLVGANNRRINRYKSKFAPDLRTFYGIERGPAPVVKLARTYGKFQS